MADVITPGEYMLQASRASATSTESFFRGLESAQRERQLRVLESRALLEREQFMLEQESLNAMTELGKKFSAAPDIETKFKVMQSVPPSVLKTRTGQQAYSGLMNQLTVEAKLKEMTGEAAVQSAKTAFRQKMIENGCTEDAWQAGVGNPIYDATALRVAQKEAKLEAATLGYADPPPITSAPPLLADGRLDREELLATIQAGSPALSSKYLSSTGRDIEQIGRLMRKVRELPEGSPERADAEAMLKLARSSVEESEKPMSYESRMAKLEAKKESAMTDAERQAAEADIQSLKAEMQSLVPFVDDKGNAILGLFRVPGSKTPVDLRTASQKSGFGSAEEQPAGVQSPTPPAWGNIVREWLNKNAIKSD